MSDTATEAKRASCDMECCDVCRWACEETGVEGTGVLSRPWLISRVGDLVEGDVIREWGDGPHLKATITVRDGRVIALWEDGDAIDAHELRRTFPGGKSGSVIRLLRTRTEAVLP